MKYKITPYQRSKPILYVITRGGEIVYVDKELNGWVGKPIWQLLDWLTEKQFGTYTVVDASCQPPRVTRAPDTETME